MPHDGLQLVRDVLAVARAKGIAGIPAIAMTAHRGRREELRGEGFAEVVEKPVNPIELCGVIGRHARRRRGHEQDHEPSP
jgi:DNA-binding response OmpR family regulator